ncbi:MAG: hypothetical protein N3A54_02380 [Patescibacteria group bacterium]|nr:hypothetical protein [Patescibacteria group bacterium]
MKKTPYFIWDYDISEEELRQYIAGDDKEKRRWAISRILSHAKYEDVWNYLTIDDIVREFSYLRLQPFITNSWKYALSVWGYHVDSYK